MRRAVRAFVIGDLALVGAAALVVATVGDQDLGGIAAAGIANARLDPMGGLAVPVLPVVAVLVVVAALARSAQLVRPDVKGALAQSTVAQMGFMVMQCSVGAFGAAAFHLVGHALYKAALFLGSGSAISHHRWPGEQPPAASALHTAQRVAIAALLPAVAVAAVVDPAVLSHRGGWLVAGFAGVTGAHATWAWLARGPGSISSSPPHWGHPGRPPWNRGGPPPSSWRSGRVRWRWSRDRGRPCVPGCGWRWLASVECARPASGNVARGTVTGDRRPRCGSTGSHHGLASGSTSRSRPGSSGPCGHLGSFIAANPLDGLVEEGFDGAATQARR